MKLKNSGLAASGLAQSDDTDSLIVGYTEPTMSSLQMVEYINTERQAKDAGYKKLRHADFLKKVEKVLGKDHSTKFFAQYTDSTGRILPCFHFPKREACLMAMSYSYELQAAIYDYMTELDKHHSGYLNYTVRQLQDIVSDARKTSDVDSSDAGFRLQKRKGDLLVLSKAERLVEALGQMKLNLENCGR
ncbi:Rha family transcriptional regulator [Enterobacter sp. MF024]|uniref:Rha family transcriptional regulator n=1 Tax=Enterobacter sp. MF024 TaxID=2555644 RepID=UPI00110607C0|nr:Rha family transcriptional regulator [Enterobacter sp. MF024]TLU68311.1 Rha family transcriptional regulator [Enterobacter sp. MF024]